MTKVNSANSTRETYKAPLCEIHDIVPEGMICQSGTKAGPGNYGPGNTNDWGDSWY